jgi:protein TonB
VSRRADIITAAVAVAVHAVAALAIARQERRPAPVKRPIEVEFRHPEPPPAPPPPPIAAPVPPPPAPRVSPRPIARKVAINTPARPTPIPPAPTPEPPSRKPAAPPVYGIAMESPIDASSAIAAPRGGSGLGVTAGGNRHGVVGGAVGGTGSGPAAPAAELSIKKMPEVDTDACGRSIHYPPEAERAGIEGKIRLRVALDARGQVTSARVLRGIGHGLDQAAVEALTHRCRFTPAIGSDGHPVAFVIESYTFAFELPR